MLSEKEIRATLKDIKVGECVGGFKRHRGYRGYPPWETPTGARVTTKWLVNHFLALQAAQQASTAQAEEQA